MHTLAQSVELKAMGCMTTGHKFTALWVQELPYILGLPFIGQTCVRSVLVPGCFPF